MESKDISLTIVGVVTILAVLVICYTAISKQHKYRIRLSMSMKFFIAFVGFMALAGFDFSTSFNTVFVIIAFACGFGGVWNAIMYND